MELPRRANGSRCLGDFANRFQFSPDADVRLGDRHAGKTALEIWDSAGIKVERTLKTPEGNGTFRMKRWTSARRPLLLALRARGERVTVFDVDTGRAVQTWKTRRRLARLALTSGRRRLAAAGGEDKMLALVGLEAAKRLPAGGPRRRRDGAAVQP